MNKCLECPNVFDKPMLYREPHGETFPVCPDCCGSYEPARECEICHGYFHSKDAFYHGKCHSCAKAVYCDELGFAYIEQPRRLKGGKVYTLEGDFYINYLGSTPLADSPMVQDALLKLLRRHFKSQWRLHCALPSYTYSSGRNPESRQLMAYCLEDITHWIDFLATLPLSALFTRKPAAPVTEKKRGHADHGHL